MNNSRESSIRVNMVGYMQRMPKRVAVLSDEPLSVLDDKGREVKTIKDIELRADESSGDRVALLDLEDLTKGEYTLKNGNDERKIKVDDSPYTEVTKALIKGLYYQRCGCALDEKHAGIYTHGACHTAPATEWENHSVQKTIIGGWHDAGDYGKYVGPGAVTVAHLLYAYCLFPSGCSFDLNIPETGNGTPDILNEARWELEWILKMQKEDGSFYHKLTKARFAPFIMPEDDKEPEYIMPVSHCATAAAVAVLALASRVYKEFDGEFSSRTLAAAIKGFEWIEKNPEFKPYIQPEGVNTGMYGDFSDRDERFWASCELYASTGEEKYKKTAEKMYSDAKDPELRKREMESNPFFQRMKKFHVFDEIKLGLDVTQYGWMDVSGLGALCCLVVIKEKGGEMLYDEVKADFLERSGSILENVKESGYGTTLKPKGYVWGSILSVMGNAMSMIINWLLTGNDDMRDGALNQLDYALGLNALDISFITGFGEKRVMNPHHRPSGADGIDEPVPGLISGGPNGGFTYPSTKERLGDTPPAKYFLDETPSADTNEIAIYWNSPAVFVAACFSTL